MSAVVGLPTMGSSATASEARSGLVLIAKIMRRIPDMTEAIACFVAMEASIRALATARERTVIAIVWIEAVIHVTVKAARSMEPRACADEDASGEPVRAVVAVRCAVIGRVIEVAIRAARCRA
jgi:hypothetical protein